MTQTDTPTPPVAERRAYHTEVHGEKVSDEYFWLREKGNPEVISYLEAENAYAEAVMRPTAALQGALYTEMVARIKETDENVPYREGDYLYYTRTEEGKQYPIYCRKPALDGPDGDGEEVTLELNEMAGGHTFMAVGDYEVSPDGSLLAYTIDTTGFREYTLFVKDLRDGRLLATRVERVSSIAWAADNRTLLYVTDDPVTKRAYRLYRHILGEAPDQLILEEEDEMFDLEVEATRSRAYLVVTASSHTTSEARYIPADRPQDAPRLVEPREAGCEYYVEHHGEHFYIRTNEGGAKNFKLVAAPVAAPHKANWREVVAHRPEVMLDDIDFFADFFVSTEIRQGLPVLSVTDLGRHETHAVEFPEPAYTAAVNVNKEFETRVLRFGYQSLVTPGSVYDYDMETRERRLLKRLPVLGGYDPADYHSERLHAIAADGTRIPVSLVYKKGLRRDGAPQALLLQAYGSYGYPHPVTFSIPRLSLLDRGLVYAIAHIRGGGEMGKEWHDQGRMMNKRNTFTDFIAAAEFLIAERYTSSGQLAITGGSAGGLLLGAVVNMRPDLFQAVVSNVPFVDVINTMLDENLPLTVGEYQEWGNPREREAYDYMRSYSPYDNLEAKAYPAMLVQTSLNDSQVMYWEPAKYVARLRAVKRDENPVLLKTNMGAGHGGASGRYDALKEDAFEYAFILKQLGITE
jgi:oligopeptidase B